MGTVAPATLHVDTGTSWRGGQQQAVYLAEGLQRAGCRVAVVCRPASPLEAGCEVRGIRCFPVPMRGEMDVLAGFRIAALSRRHGFELLHLHTAHAAMLGIWAKLARPSLRLIAVRRVDLHIRRHPLSWWKYAASPIDRVVCVSETIRNVLLADGIPAGRLVTIRSGVDLDRFSRVPAADGLRNDLGIPRDNLVVGTVAAMARHKDYPTLLAAAQAVLQAGEKVTFCVVGDGPERDKVHALARRLGLGDRCTFVGFQEDVGPYLRLFDIFVMASRTEGLGTSLIDALAVGLPVAATRAGGIGEIVKDGENGLLVSVRNPPALAGAIRRLIHDRDLRARLSAQARPSVEEFAITHTVRKNLELYQRLMQSECRGRLSRQMPKSPAG